MPDVLSASQLADERAAHRAEVAALVKERDEARKALIRCAEISGVDGEAVAGARSGALKYPTVERFAVEAVIQLRADYDETCLTDVTERDELAERLKRYEEPGWITPVQKVIELRAQRDAWAARYTGLAAAVLEGVYLNYDVKEDSGGSSFLCTCEHDGDGWPHEEWCGKVLLSTLGDKT